MKFGVERCTWDTSLPGKSVADEVNHGKGEEPGVLNTDHFN